MARLAGQEILIGFGDLFLLGNVAGLDWIGDFVGLKICLGWAGILAGIGDLVGLEFAWTEICLHWVGHLVGMEICLGGRLNGLNVWLDYMSCWGGDLVGLGWIHDLVELYR